METLFVVEKILRFPILVVVSGSKLDLFSILGSQKQKISNIFFSIFKYSENKKKIWKNRDFFVKLVWQNKFYYFILT